MKLRIAEKTLTFPPVFHIKHHAVKLEDGRKELPTPLTYECTTDMQYLAQYYFIREYAYRADLQLKHFSGQEDEVDRYSHQLIVRKGHYCVGGARMTVSTPDKRVPLALESDDFKVFDALPELRSESFCELGRLAILPEYRHHGCLERLFAMAADTARSLGCTYMMGVSPPVTARRFASAYRRLGYDSRIRTDIRPPIKAVHEHLELQFILVNLQRRER